MIEKNIFQTWNTRQLNSVIASKINSFRKMNPEYNYFLFIDEEIDSFVNLYFKGPIAEAYNKLNIIVAKVDLWRLLILYAYGGVYLDMDSSIDRPLKELIQDQDDAIITAEGNPGVYVQWALIYKKGHPILKRAIEIVVNNIHKNAFPNNILKMTGPVAYSQAINEVHISHYKNIIKHKEITNNTDVLYRNKTGYNYRIYGIDYNDFFSFKYPECYLLYINKKSWSEELSQEQLIK